MPRKAAIFSKIERLMVMLAGVVSALIAVYSILKYGLGMLLLFFSALSFIDVRTAIHWNRTQ